MPEEAQPTCIYCPRTDFSQEHYLPRCLGKFRGFEGLNDRVCAGCNGALGSLEAKFCREGPVALFRKFYGVKGRKHHKPYDPFRGPDDDRAPIEVRGSVPGEDLPARWEMLPGHEAIRPMTQLVVQDAEGKKHEFLVSESMLEAPDLLIAELKERGIEDPDRVVCFAPDDTRERLTPLLSAVFPTKRLTWQKPGGASPTIKADVDMKWSALPFARALAKIGFHYFLKNFPNHRGSEPRFEPIRTFIRTGDNISSRDDIARFVEVGMVSAENMRSMEPSKDWCGHFLAAKEDHFGYNVWAEFFAGFGGPGLACEVHLGKNDSALVYEIRKAHRFAWYPDGERGGHHGEMQEVKLLNPSWPPVL